MLALLFTGRRAVMLRSAPAAGRRSMACRDRLKVGASQHGNAPEKDGSARRAASTTSRSIADAVCGQRARKVVAAAGRSVVATKTGP